MSPADTRPYFFDAGLRFECQQCGACCTGAPGLIKVGAGDIRKITAFLQMDLKQFADRFLCRQKGFESIGEHSDGRCLFYDQGCTIYPVRPRQCRSYPFWFPLLRSPERWRREAQICPGIGLGKMYPRKEILQRVGRNMDDRSIGLYPPKAGR